MVDAFTALGDGVEVAETPLAAAERRPHDDQMHVVYQAGAHGPGSQ